MNRSAVLKSKSFRPLFMSPWLHLLSAFPFFALYSYDPSNLVIQCFYILVIILLNSVNTEYFVLSGLSLSYAYPILIIFIPYLYHIHTMHAGVLAGHAQQVYRIRAAAVHERPEAAGAV